MGWCTGTLATANESDESNELHTADTSRPVCTDSSTRDGRHDRHAWTDGRIGRELPESAPIAGLTGRTGYTGTPTACETPSIAQTTTPLHPAATTHLFPSTTYYCCPSRTLPTPGAPTRPGQCPILSAAILSRYAGLSPRDATPNANADDK